MIAATRIDQEHPEYVRQKEVLSMYRDLHAGGEQMRNNAARYLLSRHREPRQIYGERLSRVFYENYVGSIIDWYAATLFRREPILLTEGCDERARGFLRAFAEDCDLRGTGLADFFRGMITDSLVSGSSHVLVDFPRCRGEVRTRAEEDQSGASRAYLLQVPAEELINWSEDAGGRYEWVVLRRERYVQKQFEGEGGGVERSWLYLDRSRFAHYRQAVSGGSGKGIEVVDEGEHGFASQSQVPLFRLAVPSGLWLMNKAGLLQLEHFNKSNALSWALTMGLFATPVIYSDREWDQMVGESYYIQLGQGDRFGWTEPEGHVFEVASQNLARLQEEIYRVCYLLSQAGGRMSSAYNQSGLSKQRDFAMTQEVLRAYGDSVKDCMKRVLRGIIEARGDDVKFDLVGLDEFDIGEFSDELQDAKTLLELGRCSPTLQKSVLKRLAYKYLCDLRQEVKDKIASEIDANEGV